MRHRLFFLASDFKIVMKKFVRSVGEGEGGMIWENSTETCIISYKK